MDANDHDARPDRPFTDFGQFGPGKLDLRVFLQGECWVDKDGTGHLISSMSDEYRLNVTRMLLIHAAPLHMKILNLISGMIHEAIANRDAGGRKWLLSTCSSGSGHFCHYFMSQVTVLLFFMVAITATM